MDRTAGEGGWCGGLRPQSSQSGNHSYPKRSPSEESCQGISQVCTSWCSFISFMRVFMQEFQCKSCVLNWPQINKIAGAERLWGNSVGSNVYTLILLAQRRKKKQERLWYQPVCGWWLGSGPFLKNKKTILKFFYWCGIISFQFKKIINQTGKQVCCSDMQITFWLKTCIIHFPSLLFSNLVCSCMNDISYFMYFMLFNLSLFHVIMCGSKL